MAQQVEVVTAPKNRHGLESVGAGLHPTLTYSRRSNELPALNTLICSRCKLRELGPRPHDDCTWPKPPTAAVPQTALNRAPATPLAAVSGAATVLGSNYELFNCSNFNICYRSWNYRGCWHQTFPPIVTCSSI
jgi:hypothetical protein